MAGDDFIDLPFRCQDGIDNEMEPHGVNPFFHIEPYRAFFPAKEVFIGQATLHMEAGNGLFTGHAREKDLGAAGPAGHRMRHDIADADANITVHGCFGGVDGNPVRRVAQVDEVFLFAEF